MSRYRGIDLSRDLSRYIEKKKATRRVNKARKALEEFLQSSEELQQKKPNRWRRQKQALEAELAAKERDLLYVAVRACCTTITRSTDREIKRASREPSALLSS